MGSSSRFIRVNVYYISQDAIFACSTGLYLHFRLIEKQDVRGICVGLMAWSTIPTNLSVYI